DVSASPSARSHSRTRSAARAGPSRGRAVAASASSAKDARPSEAHPSPKRARASTSWRSAASSRRAAAESLVDGTASGELVREPQPREELRQLLELLVREAPGEELLDPGEVRPCRLLQLAASRRGQLRVRDAGVRLAFHLLDAARLLEPVEETRDARRRQEHALREVDAAHHLVLRVREPQQHLVVREREPVRVEEI